MLRSDLPPSPAAGCLSDERGSTYVEYLVLVGAVGIVAATAVAWLGLPLLRFYRYAQLMLCAPMP